MVSLHSIIVIGTARTMCNFINLRAVNNCRKLFCFDLNFVSASIASFSLRTSLPFGIRITSETFYTKSNSGNQVAATIACDMYSGDMCARAPVLVNERQRPNNTTSSS